MAGTSWRRIVRATAVASLSALLVTGCTSDPRGVAARRPTPESSGAAIDPDGPSEEDFDEISRLLAARASAAVSGNMKEFLRTVDPKQPKLVRQQRTLFGNLERLDLARMSYVMDRESLVSPAPVPGDADSVRPLIDEHVQLAGTLTQPVVNAVQMTFVHRASGWYVGAENQRKRSDSMESPQERPWFGSPIAVHRSGDMTVLVDRSRAESLGELVGSVRDDIAYAADVLDVEAEYDVLVDATSNGLSVDFSKLTKEEAAAVSFPLFGLGGEVGSAIKLNPDNLEQALDEPGLMRHELTHYLLQRFSLSNPTWLTEGVAMWVQFQPPDLSRYQVGDELYDELQAADRDLPGVGTFGLEPGTNYLISLAAVTRLVQREGIGTLKDFMAAYRRAYEDPNVDTLTPRLLRRIYDLRERDLVEETFEELAELHH